MSDVFLLFFPFISIFLFLHYTIRMISVSEGCQYSFHEVLLQQKQGEISPDVLAPQNALATLQWVLPDEFHSPVDGVFW